MYYAKRIAAIFSTFKSCFVISLNARNDSKRVTVTETEESDVPDKRKRDGIDGEASVNVAAVDNKQLSALTGAPCNQATVRDVGLLDYLTIL